ncbi:hypothetical protein D9M71_444410 [compost metagenome]
MLRRQPVAHGDGDAACAAGDVAADRLSAVQPANHEAAAVAPDEGRQRSSVAARYEDAQLDRTARPFDHPLDHRFDRRLAAESQGSQSPQLAQLVQRIALDRTQTCRQVEHSQERPRITIRPLGTRHLRHALSGEQLPDFFNQEATGLLALMLIHSTLSIATLHIQVAYRGMEQRPPTPLEWTGVAWRSL